MNYPEMFYKTILFFFSNSWNYFGLILIILVIRGDVSKVLSNIKSYIKSIFIKIVEYRQASEKKKESLSKIHSSSNRWDMPFYDYKCNNCGNKIIDVYETVKGDCHNCPLCNSSMSRCISSPIMFRYKDLPKGHNLSATKRREAWNSNDPNKFREIM